MAKELVITAKTVEEAIELASEQTGVKKVDLNYEVIEE